MTPQDILTLIQSRTAASLRSDEYVTFGPRTRPVTGIMVAWTADAMAIRAAVTAGHNCIVHHESLLYPYPMAGAAAEREYLSWPTNSRRLALLAEHDLTAIRIHGSADELTVFDAFVEQLGLGEPAAHGSQGAERYANKIFVSPAPTFDQLVKHVKARLKMPAIRTTVERPDRPVKRIGVPWGGLGLFVNSWFVQGLIDLGVDTLICGESDNYGFRFPAELGIAVIETSHEVSENAGLRRLAGMLREGLSVSVDFFEQPCIWQMG